MKHCPVCQLRYSDDHDRCFMDNAELVEAQDPRVGTLLGGRYQIESVLGAGGMAVVYRARSALVDRPVAVKVMNDDLVRDEALKERFRREAKNSAALAHPNIVEVLDYGEEKGVPFLVMELLDGTCLDQLVAEGPMPTEQVAVIGAQIARGLARAHDFHVLHRDLKPENVFIARGPGGRPLAKILDFGIARSTQDSRLTSAGQLFGTPQYLAPERISSIDAGASSDLYALGVMLFEMVTGRLPFEADDVPAFLVAHLTRPPPRPSSYVPTVPAPLEALILQLLAKKPEERPVDAHQVEKALLAFAPAGAMPELSAAPRSAAPARGAATLPPTTLERWAERAVVFDEMIRRSFPTGQVPPELARQLAELRRVLTRMHELRAEGLRAERQLEQREQAARETRQRLGHAMAVLGEDLSRGRVSAREAEAQIKPYIDADAQWEGAYHGAHAKVRAAASEAPPPSAPLAQALREGAEAMDRWVHARAAADQARAWLAARQREVRDLEFQTEALREQLERLETDYEIDRAAGEDILATSGRELETLDRALTEIGSALVTPLRGRPDLGDLVQRLEQSGAARAGVGR